MGQEKKSEESLAKREERIVKNIVLIGSNLLWFSYHWHGTCICFHDAIIHGCAVYYMLYLLVYKIKTEKSQIPFSKY